MKRKKSWASALAPAVYALIISFIFACFPTWSYAGYVAIGGNDDWQRSNANTQYPSVRIGEWTVSTGMYAVAIGYSAMSHGANSVAIGSTLMLVQARVMSYLSAAPVSSARSDGWPTAAPPTTR